MLGEALDKKLCLKRR